MNKKISYTLQIIFLPSFILNTYLSLRYGCIIHPAAKIYWPGNLKLGKGVRIGKGCVISAYGKTVLKRGVSLEDYCIIDNKGGEIILGEYTAVNQFSIIQSTEDGTISTGEHVAIAPYTRIVPNHKYEGEKRIGTVKGSTSIGDNVWIGAGVTIIIGRNIGRNSIIAANSVVTKDIPDNTVAGGTPAKFIKTFKDYVQKKTS